MSMKFVKLLVAVAVALGASAASAHDAGPAKFGGTVAAAGDLGFELVSQGDGATLYVDDHGKPKSTEGMTGKLTVLDGAQKTEAALAPAGANKLQATGVRLSPGAKAVAALQLPSKKVVTVRFTVK